MAGNASKVGAGADLARFAESGESLEARRARDRAFYRDARAVWTDADRQAFDRLFPPSERPADRG
jgi:hypothetical protein